MAKTQNGLKEVVERIQVELKNIHLVLNQVSKDIGTNASEDLGFRGGVKISDLFDKDSSNHQEARKQWKEILKEKNNVLKNKLKDELPADDEVAAPDLANNVERQDVEGQGAPLSNTDNGNNDLPLVGDISLNEEGT